MNNPHVRMLFCENDPWGRDNEGNYNSGKIMMHDVQLTESTEGHVNLKDIIDTYNELSHKYTEYPVHFVYLKVKFNDLLEKFK